MPQEQTIHLERYTPDAKALVAGAQQLADERKHANVEPLHLLARAVDRDKGVAAVFRAAGAPPEEIASESERELGRLPKTGTGLAYLSKAMLELLGRAEKEAGTDAVGVPNLLNALAQEIRGGAAVVLQGVGVGPGTLRAHMKALDSVPREVVAAAASGGDGKYTRDLVAEAKKGGFDPVIGRDVEVRRLLQILERRQKNHALLVGEPGTGKTAIVGALAARIAAGDVPENLRNVHVLELDTGALVAGARLRGEVEDRLRAVLAGLRSESKEVALYIAALDTLFGQGAVGAGIGEVLKPLLLRGEVRVIADTTPDGLKKLEDKDPILLRRFTDFVVEAPTVDQAIEMLRGIATRYERHHKVQIGDPAITAAVNLAKRYLQDRALPDNAIDLLDEAAARKRVELDGVPAEMDHAIRRLASLQAQAEALVDDEDAMSKKTRARIAKEIEELTPTVSKLRAELDSRRGALAAQTNLQEELRKAERALEEAREKKDFARLGELEHVTLPDLKKRLDSATEAVARIGGVTAAARVVGEAEVATVLGEWTGIPVARMLEGEADKLLKMEARLGDRVVGQEEAVRAVAKAVRRGRVGLRDPGKPIGSFLFLGTSGVGKTELAKALAEFLFDDEQALTRLDMSEFMEKHMAQRLVGAPVGYVDSEQGGFLTEAVRSRPYSVLLFDEIEKAHSDVFNLLLQVLDDGRLTDGRGRTADFSNTVVIMTSNIGSGRILETSPALFESDEGRGALKEVLQEELRSFLRPEFMNRIDDIVIFRPLAKEDLRGIVDIQLRRLEKLLKDREIRVSLTAAAKERLVELGYEPAFGARPIKRTILRNLQDPLAEAILAGGYPPGAVVEVDVDGPAGEQTFTFRKMP